jgi:predicted outer membrane repeat protein
MRLATPALLFFAMVIALRADTITVTNTNDSGPGSLRQAIVDANDGDTIDFAVSGTIGLTSGELVVDKNVTIAGPGAKQLSIDANQASDVFSIARDKTVLIAGLTIGDGQIGIWNDHATLSVDHCIVTGNLYVGLYNNASYDGITFGSASLTVTNSVIDQNSGGGVYNRAWEETATLTIADSTLSGNSTVSTGGGIGTEGFEGLAIVTVSTSTITANSATQYGGGVYNDFSLVTIVNSAINGNSAGTAGGGIYNLEGLDITDSTVSGNSSSDAGGAIYSFGDAAILTVNNCTISGNSSATYGGGIYSDSVEVTLQNSTLSGNSAGDSLGFSGGGIINYNARLTIENSTFSDNSAYLAGAIHSSAATFLMGNSVLKTGSFGANIVNDGTGASEGYNLSNDDGGGYLNGPGDQINIDPLLGPLQDNGGPTFTHELLSGSPAIDAGDPGFTPPPFYDQRGPNFFRVRNDRLDIGSFEVQAGSTPTPSPSPTSTPTSTPTVTPTPSPTPRVTPRPRPTPHLRPTLR